MLTLTAPQMVHPLSPILAYIFEHFCRYLTNKCFNVVLKKRAKNFLNRARILIIKFNNLQALFVCKTIHGFMDRAEDV